MYIWKKIILFLAVGIFLSVTQTGYAQEQNPDAVVTLFVEQTLAEKNGVAEGIYSYELYALEEGNPMPDGSEDGVLNFELTGETKKELVMVYREPGVYTYRLQQTSSEQIYTIENYVIRDNENCLVINTTIRRQDGNKAPELQFTIPTVKKETSTSQTIVKTGDMHSIIEFLLLFGISGTVLIGKKSNHRD